MGDRKTTEGKHSPLLMPMEADIAYSKVSDYGLQEYGNRDSWKENTPGDGIAKYVDAAIRHLKAAVQVGDLDVESGLPHLHHALWNAVAALWHYEQEAKNYQNREKRELDQYVHNIQQADSLNIYGKQAAQAQVIPQMGGNKHS